MWCHPPPLARGHHDDRGLSKGRNVVVVELEADVLEEFNRPDHVEGLAGPPGPPGEIVLRQYRLVRDHALLDGVVAPLDALRSQAVRDEPGGADPPPAPDVQDTLDGPVLDGVLPGRRGNSHHVDVGKASQVLGVPLAPVDAALGFQLLGSDSHGRKVLGPALRDGERVEVPIRGRCRGAGRQQFHVQSKIRLLEEPLEHEGAHDQNDDLEYRETFRVAPLVWLFSRHGSSSVV